MGQGASQQWRESEIGNRGRGQAGDKFATDAMTGINAGFENRDRHAGATQRKS
jgi:hypothetical protein